jgi:tetratricopeptide (TPR) repeat protein
VSLIPPFVRVPTGKVNVAMVSLRISAIVFGLVAASLASSVWAQGGPAAGSAEEAVQNAMAAGDQYLADEDYQSALQAYTQVTELAAFSPLGYIGRGDVYREMGDLEKALAEYNKAGQNSTGQPIPRLSYGRGKLYLDVGQIGLAAQELQAAYDADNNNQTYRLSLAKAYATGGAGPQAEQLLNAYIEEDDQNAEAYALRGRAFAAQQKFELAMADLQRAIELDPTEYETYFTLGIVRYQEKDYEAAIEAMTKSLELFEPKEDGLPFAQGFLTKASIHEDAAKATDDAELATQQLDACIATCNNLLGLLPEGQASTGIRSATLFRRGVAERLLGQFAAAVGSLTEAINENPELAEAYFRRGICWFELDEADLAVRDFERSQNIQYQNPRYYLWEGLAEAKKGDYYKAIASYNEAIALSNRYVDAFLNRAHAFMKLGEYQQAIADFNQCISLEPTVGTHYFKRGVAQSLDGDREGAIRSFTNAINFEPQLIDSYEWLAREFDQKGDRELAAEYRARAAELRSEATK